MSRRVTRSAAKADGTESPLSRIPLLLHNDQQESLESIIDRRSEVYRKRARAVTEEEKRAKRSAAQRKSLLTLPNILTILRLVLVPVFMFFFVQPYLMAAPITATLFILASLTDWLDGYLARKVSFFLER